MSARAARVCAWRDCGVVFVPPMNNARTMYHDDECRRLGKNACARRDMARIAAPAAAPAAGRREAPALRWISGASPVLMAEAQAEYRAMLAREAAAAGPGRKRGRPIHVGNARALGRRVSA